MTRQVNTWAEQNKVEVSIDYITSNGFNIQVTQAAEAQAKTGHDFLPFYNWEVNTYANQLEPVDDLVAHMIWRYGKYQPDPRVSGEIEGSLDGIALQHGHTEPELRWTDQHAEADCRN